MRPTNEAIAVAVTDLLAAVRAHFGPDMSVAFDWHLDADFFSIEVETKGIRT